VEPQKTLEKYNIVVDFLKKNFDINPITPGKVQLSKLKEEIVNLNKAGYYEQWDVAYIERLLDNYFVIKYVLDDYIRQFGDRKVNQFFSNESLDYVTSGFIFNILEANKKDILLDILDGNYGNIFLDFLDTDDRFAKLFLGNNVPLVDITNRIALRNA
jgi:hypothetical protein